MATKSVRNASNGSLESAMALLLQNQAHFVAHLAEDRRRFSRIEAELLEIKTLLLQHDRVLKVHEQILRDLPEAIRLKIGFKPR